MDKSEEDLFSSDNDVIESSQSNAFSLTSTPVSRHRPRLLRTPTRFRTPDLNDVTFTTKTTSPEINPVFWSPITPCAIQSWKQPGLSDSALRESLGLKESQDVGWTSSLATPTRLQINNESNTSVQNTSTLILDDGIASDMDAVSMKPPPQKCNAEVLPSEETDSEATVAKTLKFLVDSDSPVYSSNRIVDPHASISSMTDTPDWFLDRISEHTRDPVSENVVNPTLNHAVDESAGDEILSNSLIKVLDQIDTQEKDGGDLRCKDVWSCSDSHVESREDCAGNAKKIPEALMEKTRDEKERGIPVVESSKTIVDHEDNFDSPGTLEGEKNTPKNISVAKRLEFSTGKHERLSSSLGSKERADARNVLEDPFSCSDVTDNELLMIVDSVTEDVLTSSSRSNPIQEQLGFISEGEEKRLRDDSIGSCTPTTVESPATRDSLSFSSIGEWDPNSDCVPCSIPVSSSRLKLGRSRRKRKRHRVVEELEVVRIENKPKDGKPDEEIDFIQDFQGFEKHSLLESYYKREKFFKFWKEWTVLVGCKAKESDIDYKLSSKNSEHGIKSTENEAHSFKSGETEMPCKRNIEASPSDEGSHVGFSETRKKCKYTDSCGFVMETERSDKVQTCNEDVDKNMNTDIEDFVKRDISEKTRVRYQANRADRSHVNRHKSDRSHTVISGEESGCFDDKRSSHCLDTQGSSESADLYINEKYNPRINRFQAKRTGPPYAVESHQQSDPSRRTDESVQKSDHRGKIGSSQKSYGSGQKSTRYQSYELVQRSHQSYVDELSQKSGQSQTIALIQRLNQSQTNEFDQKSDRSQSNEPGQKSGQSQSNKMDERSGQSHTDESGETLKQFHASELDEEANPCHTNALGQKPDHAYTNEFNQRSYQCHANRSGRLIHSKSKKSPNNLNLSNDSNSIGVKFGMETNMDKSLQNFSEAVERWESENAIMDESCSKNCIVPFKHSKQDGITKESNDELDGSEKRTTDDLPNESSRLIATTEGQSMWDSEENFISEEEVNNMFKANNLDCVISENLASSTIKELKSPKEKFGKLNKEITKINTQSGVNVVTSFAASGNEKKIMKGKPTGFTTGAGTTITVSEKAMKGAVAQFQDSNDKEASQGLDANEGDRVDNEDFVFDGSFCKYDGKPPLRETSNENKEQILKNCPTIQDSAAVKNLTELKETSAFPLSKGNGFVTARGGQVNISSNALKRARTFFNELNDENCPSFKMEEKRAKVEHTGCDVNNGVLERTEEEDMVGVEGVFDDEDLEWSDVKENDVDDAVGEGCFEQKDAENEKNYEATRITENQKKPAFTGIMTTERKHISVSKDALNKAGRILQEVNNENCDARSDLNSKRSDSKVSGFLKPEGGQAGIFNGPMKQPEKECANFPKSDKCDTASIGKPKQNAKISHNDNSNIPEKDVYAKLLSKLNVRKAVGFVTAGGNRIALSDGAVKQAGLLFQDLVEQEPSTETEEPSLKQSHPELKPSKIKSRAGLLTGRNEMTISEGTEKPTGILMQNLVEECYGSKSNRDKIEKSADTELLGAKQGETSDLKDSGVGENSSNTSHMGFRTAKGNKPKISEEALERTRKVFQEVPSETFSTNSTNTEKNAENNKCPGSNRFDGVGENSSNTSHMGFRTAKGNKPKVSEEALERARKVLQEVPAETFSNNSTNTEKKTENKCLGSSQFDGVGENSSNTSQMGFRTAKGNKPKISEEALERARKVFQEVPAETFSTNSTNAEKKTENNKCPGSSQFDGIGENSSNTSHMGFRTAKGNKLKISEEALERARKIVQEVPAETFSTNSTNTEKKTENNKCPGSSQFDGIGENSSNTSHMGFRTAKGNKPKISEEALERARKVFQEVPAETFSTNSTNTENNTKNNKCPGSSQFDGVGENSSNTLHMGFRTAKGNKPKISEEALERARKVLQEVPAETFSTNSTNTEKNTENNKCPGSSQFDGVGENSSNTLHMGFRTAKGNKPKISEKSLERARKVFQEVPAETFSTNSTYTEKKTENSKCPEFGQFDGVGENSSNTSHMGFRTAKGNKPKISEESLERARKVFQEVPAETFSSNSAHTKHAMQTSNSKWHLEKSKVFQNTLNPSKRRFDLLSKESMKEAATDFTIDSFTVEANTKHDQSLKRSDCTRFRTGEGNNISISGNPPEEISPDFEPDDDDSTPLCNVEENENIDYSKFHSKSVKNASVTNQPLKMNLSIDCTRFTEAHPNIPFIIDSSEAETLSSSSPILSDSNLEGNSKTILKSPVLSCKRRRKNRLKMRKSSMQGDVEIGNVSCKDKSNIGKNQVSLFSENSKSLSSSKTASKSGISRTLFVESPSRSNIISKPLEIHYNKTSAYVARGMCEESLQDKCNYEFQPVTTGPSDLKTLLKKLPDVLYESNDKEYYHPAIKRGSYEESKQRLMDSLFLQIDLEEINYKENVKVNPEIQKQKLRFREEKRRNQRLIIENKKDKVVKPARGSLYVAKTSSRRCRLQDQEIYVASECQQVSACDAEDFVFRLLEYYGSTIWTNPKFEIFVADGGVVIPTDNDTVGVEEISNAFLALPSVDPRLVPDKWIRNHYRWIVWKLGSYDRRFQNTSRYLTIKNVMLQIKYRYDREIDMSERPALRRITEGDDNPGKRMVLCVVQIKKDSENKLLMEVTDGWYSLPAAVDEMMESLIQSGKVYPGCKLLTYGAELIGGQGGCSPLEAPVSMKLRLHSNSTRLARWHAPLGFSARSGPFPVSLASIKGNGGNVPFLNAFIARTYPLMYMERCASGQKVFRNQRMENKAAREFEDRKQKEAEKITAMLEKEYEKSVRRTNGSIHNLKEKLNTATSGEEIHQLLAPLGDSQPILTQLSPQQLNALVEYRKREREEKQRRVVEEVREKLEEAGISARDVVPLYKVRLIDENYSKLSAMLTIWKPSDETIGMLREGNRIGISALNVTRERSRGSDREIILSSSKLTHFFSRNSKMTCQLRQPPATFSLLREPTFCSPFHEIDIVGCVVYVGPPDLKFSLCQTVCLVDEEGSLAVLRVSGGLSECGLNETLKVDSCVWCGNLQLRGQCSGLYPQLYSSEYSHITCDPQSRVAKESINTLRKWLKDNSSLVHSLKERAEQLFQMPMTSSSITTTSRTTSACASSSALQSPLMRSSTSAGVSLLQTPTNSASTSNNSSVLNTPKMIENEARLSRRMERNKAKARWLERTYGEPQQMSPLFIKKMAAKPFKAHDLSNEN